MNRLQLLYRSTLGKKYVMAVTGLLLFVFVIIHMLGNLQIYIGKDALNAYGEFLKGKPLLLWGARLGLLLTVLLHIWTAIQLVIRNRRARPVKYEGGTPVAASLGSRTIAYSGLIILAFVIYHLLHFTAGVTDRAAFEQTDLLGRHDVYSMVVLGFQNVWVSAFYVLAMGLLCLHLSHGVSSMFQSLGIKSGAYDKTFDTLAKWASLAVFIGNCSIPVAVLAGLVA